MRKTRLVLLLAVLSIAPSLLAAVTLSIGNSGATPNSSDSSMGTIRTDIDLVRPASHTGSLTSVTFYWSQSPCSNAVKVKFFRRVGDTLTLVAERGPFTPTTNAYTAALTPAVSVRQGDLIGLTRLIACGNAGVVTGFPSEGYLQYASDVTGSVGMSAAQIHGGGVLAVSATGTATEWVARVIPVVGSNPGAYGAQFKTEMQFLNPYSSGTITCKLTLHAAGTAGSSADTTRLVQLDPHEVFSTSDVVAAMGQTGLGSLDVSVAAGENLPVILTRVYNDAGADGTSSLTEQPVPTTDSITGSMLLGRGVTGFLVTPRDPLRTRFNVGIRTLFSGATISVTVRDSYGVTVRTVSHTFTANYFVQMDGATFLGGPVGGDQSVQVSISSGSAIVYGSSTDNTTNDPAIEFVRGLFAIA
jgi:hypothetical protein